LNSCLLGLIIFGFFSIMKFLLVHFYYVNYAACINV
jgi:hypothetical protein